MPKVIKTVQHITDGNELYWDEAEVDESKVDSDGVYTGKPLKGTSEKKEKREKNG